ncbi:hypothetical protein GR702_19300 [Novosphingobium sp. FGD1]|uniref:Uncharacterized protein n=1 Tax=Novosphingobium silvae TaxID=2692619 RepID=A0A7X4K929_9SPHN|nr:hypothetical protein [Novosphingobium silvae]MYL99909.1 hypothetical protein [Novosphingobium silvae]
MTIFSPEGEQHNMVLSWTERLIKEQNAERVGARDSGMATIRGVTRPALSQNATLASRALKGSFHRFSTAPA